MAELICVDPARIEEAWPLAAKWIKSAFATDISDYSFEEVRGILFGGSALLWLIAEDGNVSGAVVTQVICETRKKLCVIRALGGNGLKRWRHLLSEIENYAAQQNCNAVRIYGRPGWQRVYPEYSQPWIALERKL